MSLLGDLTKLLGPLSGPGAPMPHDCEDPVHGAGLTPSVDDLLSRASSGVLGDLRAAGGPPAGGRRPGL